MELEHVIPTEEVNVIDPEDPEEQDNIEEKKAEAAVAACDIILPELKVIPVIDEHEATVVHNNPIFTPGFKRILIIGGTNTGKTYSLHKLLPSLAMPDNLFMFMPYGLAKTGTHKDIAEYYRNRMASVHIYRSLSAIKTKILDNDELEYCDHNICIIDDFNDKKAMESKELDQLFAIGRHKKMTIVMICQSFSNVALPVRRNLTHVFAFPSPRSDSIYLFAKDYFASKDEFNTIFREYTEPDEKGHNGFLNICLEPLPLGHPRILRNLDEIRK